MCSVFRRQPSTNRSAAKFVRLVKYGSAIGLRGILGVADEFHSSSAIFRATDRLRQPSDLRYCRSQPRRRTEGVGQLQHDSTGQQRHHTAQQGELVITERTQDIQHGKSL